MARHKVTPQQVEFAKAFALTGNATVAATVAGYSHPHVAGAKLRDKPQVVEVSRAETQRFLRNEAGQIAISILVEVGTDPKQPAGARVQAGKALAELSDIGLREEGGQKDPSEMDGNELHALLGKLDRQRQALEHALADKAKPIVEASIFE